MNCACGNLLGRRNKSGLCRSCSGKRQAAKLIVCPLAAAKRRATIAAWTPEQRMARASTLNDRAMPTAEMARRQARGRELALTALRTPDALERHREGCKRAGQRRTDVALAWCPPSMRDEYRRLLNKKYSAVEARRLIEEGIAAEGRREVARNQAAMHAKHVRRLAQEY